MHGASPTYDPNFDPLGADESFMDLTDYVRARREFPPEAKVVLESPCQERSTLTVKLREISFFFNKRQILDLQKPCFRLGKTCEKSIQQLIKIKPSKRPSYVKCDFCGRNLWHQFGDSAEDTVREMRLKVYNKTKLTCSAGIGPNRLIAKIASDMNKPNGQFRVESTAEKVESFVRMLPVRKMFGVGKVSAFLLREAFDIETVEDLYNQRYNLPFGFKMRSNLFSFLIGAIVPQ